MPSSPLSSSLASEQIDQFIRHGFVRVDHAFPTELAEAGRALLWKDTGCDPADPATWTRPVIRLGGYQDEPFRLASNTPLLHAAYDQLVGTGSWVPPQGLGTFPVRFPSPEPPGDDGWHVDVSFALPEDDPQDFLSYRANLQSRGRLLLMLFLFSDVGEDDAPTRIRVGSHLGIARQLATAGERGLTLRELAANGFKESASLPEVLATGPAGTVYLCHPFLVHAAQPHRGRVPRFMAQPPLLPRPGVALDLTRDGRTPVEKAVVQALVEG